MSTHLKEIVEGGACWYDPHRNRFFGPRFDDVEHADRADRYCQAFFGAQPHECCETQWRIALDETRGGADPAEQPVELGEAGA